MYFRNSSAASHLGGDLVVGVESSHGVQLSGGSTGGIVEPVGDDSAITLNVRAKGTAGIQLGVGSTSGLLRVQRYLVQFTPPAIAATTSAESTFTVVGLSTTSMLVFNTMGSSGAYIITPRCSTGDELVLKFTNPWASTFGTGQSTGRGILYEFKF